MKLLLFGIGFLFITTTSKSQGRIDWDSTYKMQLSDFRSRATQIGDVKNISLNSGTQFDFQFAMSNYEFMFTKNFNNKVNTTFSPQMAYLQARDTAEALQLVALAQYEFDLSELYARKLRQQFYENKETFSSAEFCKPVFNQLQQEYAERRIEAVNKTEMGKNGYKLYGLHSEVLKEIKELRDFCKECKPKKKGKAKRNKS